MNWFAMGGYAAYVWPAYGVAFAVLASAAFVALREHRRAAAELKRQTEESASASAAVP